GRKDESGDFTKGAGLSTQQVARLVEFIEMAVQTSTDIAAGRGSPFLEPKNVDQDAFMIPKEGSFYTGSAIDGWNELEGIRGLVRHAGFGVDQIRIDPSVVRGLEYYTGPVFEAELSFEVKNEDGQSVRFGSVGGGGRYDGLVERFLGSKVPATGFSIGVSPLPAALAALGSPKRAAGSGPVVVLVLDKAELPRYQNMAQCLRQAGVRAEMYLGTAGIKAQMKYADKRGAPCVVIQGGDERAKGEGQIKDLIEGAKAAATIKDAKEWRESRPAQFSVPEAELIPAVRDLIQRQRD